jgi:alkylhydroperoxidase family enzyme
VSPTPTGRPDPDPRSDPDAGPEPRLAPLAPSDWPTDMGDVLAALRPKNPRHPVPDRDPNRPRGLNILGLFAHHPELAQAYNTFNGHLLFGSTLSIRQRELVILRVAALRDAAYEWAQHVDMATRDAGMSVDEIARVAEGPDADDWSPSERALLRAADELVADATLTDDTWRALAAELDTHQLMDLVFTVGAYDLLAMALRTFGVPLDVDLKG